MGIQGPPHLLCFILAVVTAVFALIVLGLDGYINNAGLCFGGQGGTYCAATALGITAGVFGLLLGGLAVAWLLVSELWDVGILRFVIVFGMFFVTLLAFISGVLNAVTASDFSRNGFLYDLFGTRYAAAASFSFFLMITSALTGVFAWMAGGGGTAA